MGYNYLNIGIINIQDQQTGDKRCLSLVDDVESWQQTSPFNDSLLLNEDDPYFEAKISELQKWQQMNVFSEVENIGQKTISTRWVCNERLKGGKLQAKARLCARGCEDVEDVPTDSPTCERDNVRLLLSVSTSFKWSIHSVDIKSAYLQGEPLDRDIFLIPPKEARTDKLWKLRKCVYGINDAGKKWYNQFRGGLISLGVKVSLFDQAVFYKRDKGTLSGIMVLHVDDALWAGDYSFEESVIIAVRSKFLVSAEEHNEIIYLGLAIHSSHHSSKMDLNHYVKKMRDCVRFK